MLTSYFRGLKREAENKTIHKEVIYSLIDNFGILLLRNAILVLIIPPSFT